MRLMRFLSVGRSWNGSKREESAYRQRYGLPKFNEDRSSNMQMREKGKTQVIKPGEVLPRAKIFSVPLTTAGTSAEGKQRSVVQTICRFWEVIAGAMVGTIARFKRENELKSKFKSQTVQPELSLDKVRVIRNDLSDADLELVTAKPTRIGPALKAEMPAVRKVSMVENSKETVSELFKLEETSTH